MKIAPMILAGSMACLGLGLEGASAQTKDPALDKLASDWTAAFARGDARALAGLYTENAIRVTPEGGKVIGRAAIEKAFAAGFEGPARGAKIAISIGSVQQVSADIAVNEGTYEVTAVGPDGKPAPPVRGSYLNTIVKKGGAWLIAGNASIVPSPAPAK